MISIVRVIFLSLWRGLVRGHVRTPAAKTPGRLLAGVCLAVLAAGCHGSTAPSPVEPPTDAPTISCPASQTVTAPANEPLEVLYGSPTVLGGKSPVATSCSPPSGSAFPIGTTRVTCTATDALQRVATCELTVTGLPPPQIVVTRFAAFGDSITYGEDGNLSLSFGLSGSFGQNVLLVGFEYPRVLQDQLKGRYTLQASSISVANLGLPGELAGAPSTLTRFSQQAVQGGYDVLLIMEGSNDVNDADYSSGPRAIQAALDNLRIMVRLTRNAGRRPYLATIPPMNKNGCSPKCRGIGRTWCPASTTAFAAWRRRKACRWSMCMKRSAAT